MRTARLLAAAGSILLISVLPGCGEESGETPAQGDTVQPDTTPVVEVAPLYPEGTLNPDEVTADTPVGAAALYEAFYAWDGMQVTVAGYPSIWYGDSMVVESELDLVMDPEAAEELLTATFAEPLEISVHRGELIAVRGTAELSWTGDIEITGAVLVDPPAALEPVETSPYAYDGEAPIPVDQFAEMFNAWMGREVTVEGHYHSTTTSVTDYGTTIRVDLSDPVDTYTKYVACEMASEIPPASDSALVADRDGVLIRGTIAGESFDVVGLEGCVLVNR
ncbi:hypothetical protein JW921_11650 [Candidatus Fermentibacterales bacterium]|nr:hypothetical protein [Candidatus Fermentibacterales bacterium]